MLIFAFIRAIIEHESSMQLQTEINHLFSTQREEWDQLELAIQQLDKTKVKTLTWNDQLSVKVCLNLQGERLSAANTWHKNVLASSCFLCEPNRSARQKGIPFLDKYIILCCPLPILRNHLIIPLHSHVPQRMGKKISDMLMLTEQLPDYIVFYNSPKCGALAPHHFHLQAGLKTPALLQGDNELRTCLSIDSDDKREAEELFDDVLHYLRSRQPNEEEPMMNVIAFMERNRYRVHIFPRRAHHPACCNEEESRKMLICPSAIDMAGCLITVRERDFNKIEKEHVEEIFAQVSLPVI